MATFNINISDELKNNLTMLARELRKSEDWIIEALIENHLPKLKEDIEDYNKAIKVLEKNNKSTSWEEVQRELGLLED
jgi:predicted DNA-binding protein